METIVERSVRKILNRKSSDELVKEIHNEFDTAGDKLLIQAQTILENISKESISIDSLKKATLMYNIGFKNSKFVIDVHNKIEHDANIKNIADKDAELVLYYKEKYPNLKFLKESDLDIICKKYNLVYAPISNYIENVPDKNLNDIVNSMELDEKDIPDSKYYYYNIGGIRLYPIDKEKALLISTIKIEIDKAQFFKEEVIVRDSIFRHSDMMDMERTSSRRTYAAGKFISKFLRDQYNINTSPQDISLDKMEIKREGLFICAPKNHFNLQNLSNDKKYGFFEKMITHVEDVKDPVIFRYVKGGIQVITKWGIEAEDQLLLID